MFMGEIQLTQYMNNREHNNKGYEISIFTKLRCTNTLQAFFSQSHNSW